MFLRAKSRGLRLPLTLAVLLVAAACRPAAPDAPADTPSPTVETVESDAEQNGAVSVAPMTPEPAATPRPAAGKKNPRTAEVDWSPLTLDDGLAWLSCDLDYSRQGDGVPVLSLDRESLDGALGECADRGVLRLRYQGRIASGFAALVERITRVADALDIRKRVLDLDSAGGQVEDAIRAGDFIAASRWTIWVREDSICHSA